MLEERAGEVSIEDEIEVELGERLKFAGITDPE
jgi:hypothetical protein